MKKLVCLLLAAQLLAVWAGVSLADVSASYSNGKLTVATDEQGFWEITVDDEWIGYWVGGTLPINTIPMNLEDGEHTVIISNPDENRTLSVAFWVGDQQPASTPQPTPAAAPELQGPVKLESVRYAKGVIRFRISGLRDDAEIWLDGVYTGADATENGEGSLLRLLTAGEHTLDLYLPTYHESDGKSFSAAGFRPDAEALRATLESLVKNEAGETVASGLSIDRNDESYLLRVSVDSKSDTILTIGKDQLQALLDQGLNVIEYAAGKTALRIDLTRITDQWFSVVVPVTAYAFTLTPQADGTEVTVSALTEESGAVAASALAGLTLIRNGESTAVESNGIY